MDYKEEDRMVLYLLGRIILDANRLKSSLYFRELLIFRIHNI